MGFQQSRIILHVLVLTFIMHILSYLVLANDNSKKPFLQESKPLCHNHEKVALLLFKQSFLIDCSSSSEFASPKVNSWNESADCCLWEGVTCSDSTGFVIRLNLHSSCLYGTFPPNSTLFSLDHLLELDLADNYFNHSEIPSGIGRLSTLTHLDLSESSFSGQIPSQITKLSSLTVLDLSGNGGLKLFDMGLEKLVYNLTHLTKLFLDQVDISSTIPYSLSNLTSLQAISLDSCNLIGQVPTNLLLLPNLISVSLNVNLNLGGYLPEFRSNSSLRVLSLYGTIFSGKLPTSIENLRSLSVLDLEGCDFNGQVPSSLGKLTKLTTLSLGRNSFTGHFPSSFANLSRLVDLTLSDLMFVEPGLLTSWLPKLRTVIQLSLSNMNIGNEILPLLDNFTRLSIMDLSRNHIAGPVPHCLMNLTQLTYLDLSFNKLQGQIPQWISHLKDLRRISMSFVVGSSVGTFESFLKLPNLQGLLLYGVSLIFPQNLSTNSTLLKFDTLNLDSCNLTKFPEILRHQDEIEDLSLSGNFITGDIPQWFVNITKNSLVSLDLSSNLLTDFEHRVTVLPWNTLEVLNLNRNKLQGPLPSPPSSMLVYKVFNNHFNGVIPKQFCKATSLVYLDATANRLRGQIPSCISRKLGNSLEVLNLRGNRLRGAIPEFSRSCELSMISLSENQLEGKLPRSLVKCTMLEVLDVGSNQINDTFPSWLGNLHYLEVLVLRHNKFHGNITPPPSLESRLFHRLRIIDASNNFHDGALPISYFRTWVAMTVSTEDEPYSSRSNFNIDIQSAGNIVFNEETYVYGITITNKGRETYYSKILTVFRVIDFSCNMFDGGIPQLLGELIGIQALNLSNNNLVGAIPPSLGDIIDLESLDLSHNRLTGVIPQTLTKLTFLEIFNVSHNQLVGPTPQGKQFSTFDASSFEGNSRLCGPQLSINCDNLDHPRPPPSPQEIKSNHDEMIDWIIRLLGCATGFIIGFVIGKLYVTDLFHDWFIDTFSRRLWSKTRVKRSINQRRHRH